MSTASAAAAIGEPSGGDVAWVDSGSRE